MSCDGKTITGVCPHCKVNAPHRCISPRAELYQCRCCSKISEREQIQVWVDPKIEPPTQGRLFE